MFKSVTIPAKNNVTINGTLLTMSIRDGKSKKDGRAYRQLGTTIRVNQTYNGKEEISEIPVGFVSMKFKKDNTDNPLYANLAEYSNHYKSAEKYGADLATRVTVSGRNNGLITENMFVSSRNTDTVVSSWMVSASFLNESWGNSPTSSGDCATFDMDIFILNMDRELTSEGEETGRLKIRGGVVRYGKKIDCLDFYVENPTAIDYIERNYNINDTVNVVGRIRYTSESITHQVETTWGEDIPKTETKRKRELIITSGADEPYSEEMAYDPEEIRVLIADRNMLKEQKKLEARNSKNAAKVKEEAVATAQKYGWED